MVGSKEGTSDYTNTGFFPEASNKVLPHPLNTSIRNPAIGPKVEGKQPCVFWAALLGGEGMTELIAARAWNKIITSPQTRIQRKGILPLNWLHSFSLLIQSRTPTHRIVPSTLRTDLIVKPLWKLSQTFTPKWGSLEAREMFPRLIALAALSGE